MSNNFYEFFCPVKIIAGLAALEHAPYELSIRGGSKALIITDSGIKAAGLLEHVLTVFDKSQVEIATVYDQVPPDSSLGVVKEIADIYRQHQCDSIIAPEASFKTFVCSANDGRHWLRGDLHRSD